MTHLSMLTRAACLLPGSLLVGSLIAGAALAQAATLVTGLVTNSYTEGGSVVIELSEANNCGSSKYVSKTDAVSVASVQEAIDGAAEIEGVVTIKQGACVNGGAQIEGIAYGPDI